MSSALTAYQNLVIKLIENQCSSELALQCAKAMLIDTNQATQSPYQKLLAVDSSGDPVAVKAQYWLQTHMQSNVDLAELSKKMGVSQRTLIRRFKLELNATPLHYLQNIGIETAKTLLEST